jgi:hypothetical protein
MLGFEQDGEGFVCSTARRWSKSIGTPSLEKKRVALLAASLFGRKWRFFAPACVLKRAERTDAREHSAVLA